MAKSFQNSCLMYEILDLFALSFQAHSLRLLTYRNLEHIQLCNDCFDSFDLRLYLLFLVFQLDLLGLFLNLA